MNLGSAGAEICVIGRTSFVSAVGAVGYAAAELLARSFPVSFLPTEPDARALDHVTLPNGRILPVCRDPGAIKASVFCDVLRNGAADRNWSLAPTGSLKYAWLTDDSDRLPPQAVELLNCHFDLVIAAGPHQVQTARLSGVESPIAVLPLEPNRSWEPSFSRLTGSMAALIDPSIGRYRARTPPPGVSLPPEFERLAENRLGRRADRIGGVRRQVCAAYDAGFFSIFNSFMSHLVWQEREDRCHAVLPDWDVERLDRRLGGKAKSFCYGQTGDGNLWLKLFEPLFGATEAEMQDEAWLWRHAEAPFFRHNEHREPLLTYTHAYKLYRSRDFEAWRRQYHRVLSEHVHLRPELLREIDDFAAAHLTAPVLIAAHVRHPSHTVEQPGGQIAHTEAYIDRVRDAVRQRGADPDGADWAVFVATDQERVLHRFRAAFGARAVFYPEARRTRADEDAAFDALSPEEQNRDGHQLQHLVAADRSTWSWRMAWEVVRDAYTMARCQCLLHVVSNVSTAVAYMNPRLEMVFCPA